MAARLAVFVNRYAVNLLYWDQWDFLQGLFDGADAWTLFRWQHGAQRQGLSNLISAITYPATGWNTRADAAAAAVMMLLATLAALWLVKRVCGRLRPWDAVVPLLFLTITNAETYAVAPNLAHGPLSILLLTIYALALTIPSHAMRCGALVVSNFLCVNTGYTLLIGGLTPVLLLACASGPRVTSRERAIYAAGIAASLATLALFLHGFVAHPATDCFHFPHERPWEYLPFTGFVMGRPLGLYATDVTRNLFVASGIALGATGFLAYAAIRLLRTRGDAALWAVTCALGGFGFLFASTSAVGRVCLGYDQAIVTRYIPYMLPSLLAVYLVVRTKAETSHLARVLLPVFVVVCIAKERPQGAVAEAQVYSQFKERWRACYLTSHDVDICNSESGHAVYPEGRAEATHLQQKLDWLEARGYNLFQKSAAQVSH